MTNMKTNAPVAVGEHHEVTAVRLNDDGDGVATVEGLTVFIPYLLPGEKATVRVIERQRRFARATLVERHTSATDRQDAPCPVFGECGGCQVQHLAYASQLAWKAGRIARVAKQLGLDADTVVRPIIGSESPFRYRNQVQMPVAFDAEAGKVKMGFFGAQSHRMIETDSCHLQSEAMQKTLVAACAFLTKLGSALATKVHHVIVRESAMNGEQLVVFASHANSAELKRALIRFKAVDVTTVGLTVQPKIGGPVWGRTVEILRGTGMLQERIGDILFRVSPRSFLQVQAPLAEQMYETVRAYAALTPTDTIIDAYCGIGTMTLMLAQTAQHAIGIEEVAAAVADARANQADNGIEKAEFVAGQVETWLPKWVADGHRADVAVFDPPRKGIDPAALAAVAEAAPRRIVYASCNPATLQRDLKYLMEHGYAVEAMQPLDMFPQTSHVETVVRLVREFVTQ